jgi:hypothetical protein
VKEFGRDGGVRHEDTIVKECISIMFMNVIGKGQISQNDGRERNGNQTKEKENDLSIVRLRIEKKSPY